MIGRTIAITESSSLRDSPDNHNSSLNRRRWPSRGRRDRADPQFPALFNYLGRRIEAIESDLNNKRLSRPGEPRDVSLAR
jgi:hypothetical protein